MKQLKVQAGKNLVQIKLEFPLKKEKRKWVSLHLPSFVATFFVSGWSVATYDNQSKYFIDLCDQQICFQAANLPKTYIFLNVNRRTLHLRQLRKDQYLLPNDCFLCICSKKVDSTQHIQRNNVAANTRFYCNIG